MPRSPASRFRRFRSGPKGNLQTSNSTDQTEPAKPFISLPDRWFGGGYYSANIKAFFEGPLKKTKLGYLSMSRPAGTFGMCITVLLQIVMEKVDDT